MNKLKLNKKCPKCKVWGNLDGYKKWGYETEKYSPLFHSNYWLIFASKIFKYPHPNDAYIRNGMIRGGYGFDIYEKLPSEIDHIYPDYELYNCDYVLGYITKGCIRNCTFCIVPEMEGNIYKFAELEEFCKDQEKVRLLDNNILAYKDHIHELEKLYKSGKRFDFTQGLDIRLITYENASILANIHLWKGYRLKFAFDDPTLKNIIEKKLEILYDVGFLPPGLQFYMLIGFNTNYKQDLIRVNFLKEKGIAIFVMPYNKLDSYQQNFARWVNRYFYKYLTFQEYLEKKNKLYLLTESKEEAVL